MKKRELNKLIKRSSEIKAEIENPDSKPDYSQVLINNHIEESGYDVGCDYPLKGFLVWPEVALQSSSGFLVLSKHTPLTAWSDFNESQLPWLPE